MKKVIIIGGGASGLYAAAAAAEAGAKVILLEKNSTCGRKLNICGKGRGNITNTAEKEDFIRAFGKNGRFLYSAFSCCFRDDLLWQLKELGIETISERGGRVFPSSQKASDITQALVKWAEDAGVQLRTGTKALSVEAANGIVTGVKVFGGTMNADSIIIATGGLSYPATGSTGDGFGFAKAMGHTVTPLRPSLCGFITAENWPSGLSGLTLKNVRASLCDKNGKSLAAEMGEMLFTHKGVSGPIILTLSKTAAEKGLPLYVSLDLKPAIPSEELEAGFIRDFQKKQLLSNYLEKRLPKALAKLMPELAEIRDNFTNKITAADRKKLVNAIKDLRLSVKSLCPIEEAIITMGGVSIGEINPATMESKLVKGLYFCGEVIDVDAKTGGYNLQAAFSTGYTAGINAASD